MPDAIDSQNGSDSSRATTSRPGCRTMASPSAKVRRNRVPAAAIRAGSEALEPRLKGVERPGCPARKNITASARQRRAPSAPPPIFRRLKARGSPRAKSGSANSRNSPNSISTITVSSTRSRMMVAKAAVALRPSLRASSQGRNTSPARAGSTALAANPITVIRRAFARLTRPTGESRYCHRIARRTYVSAVSATDRSTSPIRARVHLAPTRRAGWRCAGRAPAGSLPAAQRSQFSGVHASRSGESGVGGSALAGVSPVLRAIGLL